MQNPTTDQERNEEMNRFIKAAMYYENLEKLNLAAAMYSRAASFLPACSKDKKLMERKATALSKGKIDILNTFAGRG